jgi:hypothetical protein
LELGQDFGLDDQFNAAATTRLALDQAYAFEGQNHLMNGRRGDGEESLDVGFGGWAAHDRRIRQLFEQAELDATFQMRVMLSPALCDRLAVTRNISAASYSAVKADVMQTSPITHRADADARYWANMWLAITQ